MKRRALLAATAAACLLLAACSSGGDTAATTSASSAAETSEASATESQETSASGSATTTVGGDTTEFDAQTTTWFETFCTGIAPFADLQSGIAQIDTPQELGDLMTTVGTAFGETGAALESVPPPTFEGGAEVAAQVQTGLQDGGQIFTDYGQRAAEIDPNDEAAGEQFFTEFTQEASALQVTNFDVTPEVRAAIRDVPACAPLFSG